MEAKQDKEQQSNSLTRTARIRRATAVAATQRGLPTRQPTASPLQGDGYAVVQRAAKLKFALSQDHPKSGLAGRWSGREMMPMAKPAQIDQALPDEPRLSRQLEAWPRAAEAQLAAI